MTMPKGWKSEQTTTTKEKINEQKEQSSSKNEQTTTTTTKENINEKKEQSSSIITLEDKVIIQELIAKHNIDLDNKNIDDWTNSWTDDGVWNTPFGEAKGKTDLKNMITQVTNEFASGKRHLSTNIIIESVPNNKASARSYLIVTEAKRTPEVVASGTYSDSLVKDANGKWKFVQRKLDIDLVNDSK
jgi:ketosteroid isomerase-like protein